MYELLDNNAAIKEVQKFLYVISDQLHPEIPRISIDGIYGKETQNAVKVFQNLYSIDSTGNVDRETFELLYIIYSNEKKVDKISFIDYDLFPIEQGDKGNHVLHTHLLIRDLQESYNDIGNVSKTSYFSEESEKVVKNLQKIFRLEENGKVDHKLYERMLIELDALRRV